MQVLSDLRVLKPVPRGVIRYGDPPVDYPVMSLIDVPYGEMVSLLAIAKEAAAVERGTGLSLDTLADKMRAQLKVLVPSITDTVLDGMTYRELMAFLTAATGGDEGPSEPPVEPATPAAATTETEPAAT